MTRSVIEAFARSSPRAAVTGAAGFVGQHLVATLARLGVRVTSIDRAEAPRTPGPGGVIYHRVDLHDPSALTNAISDVDVVFHLAGNSSGALSVRSPRLDFAANAWGTFCLCEALRIGTVRRVVYLSSAMVYGVPQSLPVSEDHKLSPIIPYGATKLSGEFVLQAYRATFGLDVVIGRAFTIYGPGESTAAGGEVSRYLRWQLNECPIEAVGDVDRKTRDFVHVDDVVQALLVMALKAPAGAVYNIGSGRETSLRDLLQQIARVSARNYDLRTAANPDLSDTYRLFADIRRLQSLGFRPETSLWDGLQELRRQLGTDPELPRDSACLPRGDRGAV